LDSTSGVFRFITQSYDYENSWEAFDAVNHPPTYDQEWPGPMPLASTRFVMTVNVKFDAYPDEISWQLERSNGPGTGTWTSIRSLNGADTEGANSALVSVEVSGLTGDTWHRFWINDRSGDGICCTFRRGWVSLTAPIVTTQQNGLVWGNNGEFGNQVEVYIFVNSDGFVSQVAYTDPTTVPTARTGTSTSSAVAKRRTNYGERQRQLQGQLDNISVSYTDLPKDQLQ